VKTNNLYSALPTTAVCDTKLAQINSMINNSKENHYIL